MARHPHTRTNPVPPRRLPTPFLRPLVLCATIAGLASVLGPRTPPKARSERSISNALGIALEARGFDGKTTDIRWIDSPTVDRGVFFGTHRFVALLQRAGELRDIWLGRARLSPEGRFVELTTLYNLSDTSAVDETNLQVSGERVAWSVESESETVAIQVADLRGRQLPNGSDMNWVERWQTRITFLQETGQLSGICRRAYRWQSPPAAFQLAWTDSGLRVESNGRTGHLGCEHAALGELSLVSEPSDIGSPGDLITWAVDRVRALPWFGTDRMQWVKAIAFAAWERWDAVKRRVVKHDSSSALTEEVGDFLSRSAATASDPATGWPPQSIDPILSPALPQEGAYRTLDDDPFAVPPWGGASPFAFAFVRPDPSRPESRVFVTAWDPRRLELHTMTGTREPKTATGETGSGTVPRDDATIGHLAAAFNGGFQATHGEFGMMAQRVVYLPPKAYAATVVELADGTSGFGTWPDDESIPGDFVGFRQNLTPLLANGTVNPYGRTWWGGVPPGWQDATRTVRTGLCLTNEGHAAYFYGSAIGADHLASAMTAAHCRYGIHLDMNPGHTGFEFYRVGPAATLPKFQRKLDSSWEARGPVPGAAGYEFIGRRMLRTMHLMHFPRYVRTDSRDFFYLTHRNLLPPFEVARTSHDAQGSRDAWHTKEHAQHGFPPAIASTRLRPDPERPNLELAVVGLDAKWSLACRTNCGEGRVLARMSRSQQAGLVNFYQKDRHFIASSTNPPDGAVLVASGKDEAHASKTSAAIGIARRDWLFYAEVTRGGDRLRDAKTLSKALRELGCNEVLLLDRPLELTLGDAASSGGGRDDVIWIRDTSPMTKHLFTDTPVVGTKIWQPLQSKRVRYIRQRTRDAAQQSATDPAQLPAPDPVSGPIDNGVPTEP